MTTVQTDKPATRPLRAGSRLWGVAGLFAFVVVALAAALPAAPGRANGLVEFMSDDLVVVTGDGSRYPFQVELALTPKQRAQGLMFRETLADDAGMLFLFDREAPLTFWMKNTIVSLDIIYLDKNGRVVSIAPDAEPFSTDPIPSGAPAAGVLEVVAGTAQRLGIDDNAYIEYRAFGTAP